MLDDGSSDRNEEKNMFLYTGSFDKRSCDEKASLPTSFFLGLLDPGSVYHKRFSRFGIASFS